MQTRENYIQASFFSFLIHAIIFLYLVGFFYSEKQLRPILSQAVNVNIIVDTASEKILQKPNLNQISKSNPIENINIEKLLKELESIVLKMEDDSLNLEDSLESYEKGISLVKSAQESLKKIEQRVQILSHKNNLEDFNPDD